MVYDRTKPFNDLPLLTPDRISEDVDILKKLVTTSRALARVNCNVQRLPNHYMLINTMHYRKQVEATLEHGKTNIKLPAPN
jgi:hypothetical protein